MTRDESRLILPRRPDSLKPLLAFAHEKASQAGFTGRGVKEVELAVEEMAADAIEHPAEPGMEDRYEVALERRPGQFAIAVEDRCAPFDLESAKRRREAGLGLLLVGAFADVVRFENLGAKGRRVEIVKSIPSEDLGRTLAEGNFQDKPLETPETVTIRQAGAEDCELLGRLCFGVSGRADAREFLYFPDRLREMIASKSLEARVAVAPGGRIVGACLASQESADVPVAVAGPLLQEVFKGGEAFSRELVSGLLGGLRSRGVYGLLCEFPDQALPETYAPFGATETALLLGHWPAFPSGGKGRKKSASRRQSVLLGFVRVGEGPAREVYPPYHHAGILRATYAATGLKRLVKGSEDRPAADLPPASRVDVELRPSMGRARLAVRSYGRDLLDHLYLRLEDLDHYGVELADLDLPLSDPATASFVLPAETLGFFYAGVIPELYGGDVLRLQRLKCRRLDLPGFKPSSELGAELASYVWREYISSAGTSAE